MSNVERAKVSNRDFLRVVIVERDKFPLAVDAANELGFASTATFRARLKNAQERWPEVFEGVEDYPVHRGQRAASANEMLDLLSELKAESPCE